MFKSLKSIIISLIIVAVFVCFVVIIIVNNNPQIVTEKHNTLSEDTLKFFKNLFIIESILLVITLNLCKKTKFKQIYIRDTEKVIEPVLAEAIIDRKIDIKELIMTCMINLINKGNLKIIENDKLQLITDDNISEYEKKILELLFLQKGQIISFAQIKEVFIHDNKKTMEFSDKIKNIKNLILEKLYNDGIYSWKEETKLKRIRIICAIICFFIMLFIFTLVYCNIVNESVSKVFPTALLVYAINIHNKFEGKKVIPFINKIFLGFSCVFYLYILLKGDSFFIYGSLLVILNIITIKLTQTHIFTLKGKEEYIKAQCLKAYIEDYSLLDEKDIESTIIWEDYLAYAVAFGISNKVTDKFSEGLLNLNLALQDLDKVLKF